MCYICGRKNNTKKRSVTFLVTLQCKQIIIELYGNLFFTKHLPLEFCMMYKGRPIPYGSTKPRPLIVC